MLDGWTEKYGLKNNVVLTHPNHEGKWCSKFGWIRPNGLGKIVWWTDGQPADAWKNNVALAHLYHEGKWCSKFCWIPPSGLGGDSVMDRHMDRQTHRKIMLLSHTLTMRGIDAESLVEFHPVVQEIAWWTDRWMEVLTICVKYKRDPILSLKGRPSFKRI